MTTRRDFVRDAARSAAAGSAAVLLGAPALLLRSRADADIIVRNGTIFDGTGAPGREADVVIARGRIAALSRSAAQRGVLEIDARGLAVAPGFIDIHSHGDGSL